MDLDYRNYDWVTKIQKVQKPIKAASPPLEDAPKQDQNELP